MRSLKGREPGTEWRELSAWALNSSSAGRGRTLTCACVSQDLPDMKAGDRRGCVAATRMVKRVACYGLQRGRIP